MKINDPRITFLPHPDYTTIEVTDSDAAVCFLRLRLTPEQLSAMLSRRALTKCETGEVFDLDKLGKRMEHKNLKFPLPEGISYGDKKAAAAAAAALEHCPEGWESDQYFGSQGSFFNKKGKEWAQTHIRRWVEIEEG